VDFKIEYGVGFLNDKSISESGSAFLKHSEINNHFETNFLAERKVPNFKRGIGHSYGILRRAIEHENQGNFYDINDLIKLHKTQLDSIKYSKEEREVFSSQFLNKYKEWATSKQTHSEGGKD